MATPTQLPNGNWSYTNPQGITTVGTQESVNAAANQPVPQPVAPTAQPVAQPAPVTQPTQTAQPAPTTQSTTQAAPATSQTASQTAVQPAVMPSNGSVVDLLNQTGQSSAFAERAALAKQFGIQGYTGSATQNTDLAKKYLDFYNSKQGTAAPNSNPRQEIQNATGTNTPTVANPEQSFFDNYMTMNPVVKNLYDQINQQLSAPIVTQTFADQYKELTAAQGIPALQTELMNVNNIIDGTEDDIRDEITKAGGFATESQILAMKGARNKTLIKQANNLSQQLQQKEDYVNQIMQFSQLDRAEVDKQVDRKLGLTEKLATLTKSIDDAAKDNFNNLISKVGYAGLATALQGDPQQTAQVEKLLGLSPGGLQKLATFTPPQTEEDKLKLQNMRLQNAKLQKDLNAPVAGKSLQFVSGTANQPAGVFNPATGAFTPVQQGGTVAGAQQLAIAQDNISQVNNLLKSPALSGVVGPNPFARFSLNNLVSADSQQFLGTIQQLTDQLTLTNLQNAKANGATFGALSEPELDLLKKSATKLNAWAIKNSSGAVTGFNVDEGSFKSELDRINNYAKLDYILKGGDPTSVGVQQTSDGKFWTQNSDGSYTELK